MPARNVFTHDTQTGEIKLSTVEYEPPPPDPIEQRRDAYQAISADEIFEALFEHFEGRPEKLALLMKRRAAIKQRFPKG